MNNIKGLSEKKKEEIIRMSLRELYQVGYDAGFANGQASTVEDLKKQLGIKSPSEYFKPKTANQQRAETIQRAREFVEEYETGLYNKLTFHVNAEKRTVVALIQGRVTGRLLFKGIAKCMPGDVFNADIGKAIALAKALQIDVPQEFLEAVQPSKAVIGTIVERYFVKGEFREVAQNFIRGKTCTLGSDSALHGKIIDDTNAEYRKGE